MNVCIARASFDCVFCRRVSPLMIAKSSGRLDMDLTLPNAPAEGSANVNMEARTADKPIELDLE